MELPNKYTTQMQVLPSSCDFTGRLGVFDTFKTFMDLANDHARLLKVDQQLIMHRNLFWLTVKTRIQFHQKPDMSTLMTAETWPVKPGSLKTDRCYRLSNEKGIIAEGRTEWAVFDLSANRLVNTSTVFPVDMEFSQDNVAFSDFPRVTPGGEGFETKGTYRVSSYDIDMGMHMNNTAYVRALLGLFTVEELKNMDIKDISIIFKSSAHEGDILTMQMKKTDNVIETGLFFPDGKPAVLARIVC